MTFETTKQMHDVIVGVRGQRVAAGVEAETGAARHTELELDVGGFWLIKLHVPIAVGSHGAGHFVAERQLLERCAVWRERPRRERVCS